MVPIEASRTYRPSGSFREVIAEGDRAPDFALPDQHDEPVRLSERDRLPVVLYFYPKADTPGCTKQACGIRDRWGEYESAGVEVIGVSPDSPEDLAKFAGKYGLPFTLVADSDHEVAERYGVWAEKSMYGRKFWGNLRATFVIAPGGTVAKVFPKVSPATHDDVVLAALRELAGA